MAKVSFSPTQPNDPDFDFNPEIETMIEDRIEARQEQELIELAEIHRKEESL